jgi:chitinase
MFLQSTLLTRILLVSASLTGVLACSELGLNDEASQASQLTVLRAQFTKTSDWKTGYVARYTVTNAGDTAAKTWTLEFDLPAGTTVSSLWNGVLERSGNHYVVRSESWSQVAPGGSVNIGFEGTYSGTWVDPSNCRINGVACDGSGGGSGSGGSGSGGSGSGGSGSGGSGSGGAGGGTTPPSGGTGGSAGSGNPSGGSGGTAGGGGTPTPGGGDKRVIGYFTEWGVYGRNYHVKNIDTSGSAAKLTHINYAFGNVANSRCVLGDAYADTDKFYDAGLSVDGKADTWDNGALRGSFNQLLKLKKKHPHLKVMISLGGWTWSAGFSDAALPQNRASFVKSCVDLFIKEPRWAGLFDGIDIDWEYPGTCGNTCNYRAEDTQNFTALLAEFRTQLNAAKPGSLLTIAAPAGVDKIAKIQVAEVARSLDFINLMTYDMHGAWESTTNFHSPLYNAAGNPQKALKYSTDEAVQAWLRGGTPKNKLVVGVPFYGRGWTGVGSANNGLWQSATGGAPGTYEAGIEDYKVLKNLEARAQKFRHPETQAFWIYDSASRTFWSYDDPTSLANKAQYVRAQGLGGAMFWELSGDDSSGSLISALKGNL